MVEETFNIGTYDIDKEARYKIIKQWLSNIKEVQTFGAIDILVGLVYFIILMYAKEVFQYQFFSFMTTWILLTIFLYIYYVHIKKAKQKEILEEFPPNSIKFKCGVIENSIPMTVEVKNVDDKISVKYHIWGSSTWGWGAKNTRKLKEKWASLIDDLERMLKSQKHNENFNRPGEISKLEGEKGQSGIKKFCPGCGRSNDRQLKFCAQCGTKLFAN